MEEGKENITYSAEDIRKYLEGHLSDREMQALEKAALEDPFLADAIEGLEESRRQSVSFESNISDLQKRLADRIHPRDRKRGIIYFLSNWQVAASVLFVIGTAVLTFTFINNRNKLTNIAKTLPKDSGIEKQNPRVQDIVLDSAAVAQKNSTSTGITADSTAVALSEPPSVEKKSRTKKVYEQHYNERNDKISKSKVSDTSAGSVAMNKDISGATNPVASPVSAPQQAEALLNGRAAGVVIPNAAEISRNYIQGVVVDDSNKPIPFARVNLSGSKKEVSTNDSGYFKMYLEKSRTPREVIIKSIGYQPVSTEFNPDSTLIQKFRMQVSPGTLNEVVVSGYSTKNKEESEERFLRQEKRKTPDPVGWDSLLNYIDKNKYNISADSLLKGEEVISFTVNNKNELSSFKVLKSISPIHDAEIIRLIKSGPPIKPQKGKKQFCQMTILFK